MESVELFEGPEKLMEVWWTPILVADRNDVKSRRDDFNVLDNFNVSSIKTSIIRKFKYYTKVRETSFSVFLWYIRKYIYIYIYIYIYQKYTDIRNIPEIYQEYIIF